MSRGTTLRNFRCDDERWERYVAACRDAGTDASRQIREMIDEWLEKREK